MAERRGEAARVLNSVLLNMKAAYARLDADCTSLLRISDLKAARLALQPVFALSDSLMRSKSVDLDEAIFYSHEARLCGLLLSLLRHWPWAEMRHSGATTYKELALLPCLLNFLRTFLCMAARLRSSEQAAAFAGLSKRCLSQSGPERTWWPGSPFRSS